MPEYLAVKNWAKFQPLRGKGKYIFDYTQQDDEPALAKLSFFQRGVYQEIRRYRGRSGKNMLNDNDFIASSTCARLKDRPRLPQAIRELTACGLLVLTNQEVDVLQAGDIDKENDKEKDIKPSARKARGSVKPTDPRFHHCVDILHRYWDKFIKGKVRFEVWMDSAGYRQLKNSLKRSGGLSVEEFTRCVANRARSPGVDHGEPAYKWLGHVTEWAGGPKNGRGTSKAEQRVADMAETTRAVFSGSGSVSGNGATGLPDATSGRGAGDLAGDAKRLLARGSAPGNGSPSS